MTSSRGAYLVGAGILASRMFGLVRQRILSHFLGLSDGADILAAAFRIPNLLQNLFGEGAMSASFIPVYARLRATGDEQGAHRLARAMMTMVTAAMALLVAVGIIATPFLVKLLVGDWPADKVADTERLVRIIFPGIGLLVLAALQLGVLNAHRRFFAAYASPVLWNLAIIVAVVAAPAGADHVVTWAAWGSVAGAGLQVLMQWQAVRQVAGALLPGRITGAPGLNVVGRNFVPATLSRGAGQVAGFIDLAIAGFLPGGALAALTSAQLLYQLPVSLFGMAVSAAELPEMASEQGDVTTVARALRVRIDAATQRLSYYIVPSAMAMVALGGVLAGAVFQTGRFTASDTGYVWLILAAAAVGLLAATLARLYSSAFYALHDAATPLRFALIRIAIGAVGGATAALYLPAALGLPRHWGAAGIAIAGGIAGWIEFVLLRRSLCRRLGQFSLPREVLLRLWAAAIAAAIPATGVRLLVGDVHPVIAAALILPVYCGTYLAATWRLNIPEAAVIVSRLGRARRGPVR